MEMVNLQSVAKGVSPKASPAAISPTNVAANKVKPEVEVSGNMLPLAEDLNKSTSKVDGEIERTVSELNNFVQNIQRGIQFSVHEETGRSVITITDKETGDEIRRFPSEQLLAISAHISETMAVPEERGMGLLVNGKA